MNILPALHLCHLIFASAPIENQPGNWIEQVRNNIRVNAQVVDIGKGIVVALFHQIGITIPHQVIELSAPVASQAEPMRNVGSGEHQRTSCPVFSSEPKCSDEEWRQVVWHYVWQIFLGSAIAWPIGSYLAYRERPKIEARIAANLAAKAGNPSKDLTFDKTGAARLHRVASVLMDGLGITGANLRGGILRFESSSTVDNLAHLLPEDRLRRQSRLERRFEWGLPDA